MCDIVECNYNVIIFETDVLLISLLYYKYVIISSMLFMIYFLVIRKFRLRGNFDSVIYYYLRIVLYNEIKNKL